MAPESSALKARWRQIAAVLRRHKLQRGITPVRLRETLEELGPTFIKAGQILSMRTDMLPREYCAELKKLRSDVAPMSYEEVSRVISASCGKAPQELFVRFDKTPLGSASIAQVHFAALKSGESVVVKVQREGIYDVMREDIELCRKMSGVIRIAAHSGGVVDIPGILEEVWKSACCEMDFCAEADNLREFARQNEDIRYIGCPRVYDEHSTDKVLVMEYVDGISVLDKQRLIAEGYDIGEIGAKLAENYVTQVVDNGFFHADPHPGNMTVRGGQLVWLDLGMMGRLSERDRIAFRQALSGIAKQDADAVSEAILKIGICRGEVDRERLSHDISRLLGKYASLDLGELDLALLMEEGIALARAHRISMPDGITMLARGIVTIEGVVAEISPATSFVTIMGNHIAGDGLKNIDWRKEAQSAGQKLLVSSRKALELPALLADDLTQSVSGKKKINAELQPSAAFSSVLRRCAAVLGLSLVASALLIAGAMLAMGAAALPVSSIVMFAAAAAAAGAAVWLAVRKDS